MSLDYIIYYINGMTEIYLFDNKIIWIIKILLTNLTKMVGKLVIKE